MRKLADFHDTVLTSIEVNWSEGKCSLTVRAASGTYHLSFAGLTALVMFRSMPWGPSASINEIREASKSRYEIEMQSGDTIAITASAHEISA